MRKQLFVTLMLSAAMSVGGSFAAFAEQAPQTQSQGATTITGTVLDENNEPVIGANIALKGAKGAAVNTDFNGNFTIRVTPGAPLLVNYVGYKTAEVKAAPSMTVYLQPTTEQLEQLVVVGYGTQKKANLTGAVATVDVARVMDSRPQTDVVKALQGAVPGLTITTGDGGVDVTSTIKIRGTGTLSNDQTSNPLIVVDGVPVDDLSFVNPDDIADISVLKDASSAAIYGTRAAFGVILITTKTPSTQDRVSVKYTNNFGWSQATKLPDFADVPSQLRAGIQVTDRDGGEAGFFGMNFAPLLPYAEAWAKQNTGKAGHRVMRPFKSWDDVGDYYWDADNKVNLYYADWDVAGILYNDAAPSQKHNVSLEGRSGKTSYRTSFGYDDRQDLMEFNPDKMKRYTANVMINTEIFDWLRAGVRFNYAKRDYQTHYTPAAGRYNNIWRWGSFWTVLGQRVDNEGDTYEYRTIASREQAGNDRRITDDTKLQAWLDADIIPGLTLHADFTYDTQSFNRTRVYNPIYSWDTWTQITNPYPLGYFVANQSNTEVYQYNTKMNMWNTNVYATYAKTFANAHNLKVMVGGTAEKHDYDNFWVGRDIMMNNDLPYLGLTTGGDDGTAVYLDNTLTHRATAGFFGRVNYDYKGIYLFEANIRRDGSSSFPADDQWAWFPSFSAGYRFTEEPYFQPIKATNIITNGKIRASYGHIGNEAVGDYRFLSTINNLVSSNVHWLNSGGTKVGMMTTPTLVSSNLTWERVITTDVGLDLGFFNNSLNLTFDWFQRDTKDMLAPANEMPATLGANAPYVNAGHLRTRGWEIGIGWNHSFGDADVYANFNIYDGKTKVENYNTRTNLISDFYTGQTYGEIWGFETDRYFEESDFTSYDSKNKTWTYAPGVADQSGLTNDGFHYGPGDIKFRDLDGDGRISGGFDNMYMLNGKYYIPRSSVPAGYTADRVGNVLIVDNETFNSIKNDKNAVSISKGTAENHGDLKVIGNATPRYEYSFRIGGAWKGFDLDMFFQGVGKRDMWTTGGFIIPYANNDDVIYANQMDYNQQIYNADGSVTCIVNQNAAYPALYGSNAGAGTVSGLDTGRHNFYPQSKYLMNMAYLRFKTLTVGYTLPVELTRKALIQKARIYFSADNLCFLYDGMRKYPLDPEIGSQWAKGINQTGAQGEANGNSNGYFGRRAPISRTFSFGLQVTF